MILPILTDDHPILAKRSRNVTEFGTPFLQELVGNMWQTMQAAGGIGLAAPQVGYNLNIIVFGIHANERYPDAENVPPTVLINPKVHVIGDEQTELPEGCLSLPGQRGLVTRPSMIHYEGYDVMHRHIEREVTGWHARVVLHEVDHLKGILFTERLEENQNDKLA